MKKYFFILGVFLGSLLAFHVVVHAEGNLGSALGNLGSAGQQAGTSGQSDVGSLVGSIVNGALTLVGTIFFILMVYAGYLWLGSRGEEEKVEKAKDIIRASIIGLVVVLSAYAITVFVTGRFSSGGACTNQPEPRPFGCNIDCGTLSAGDCTNANVPPGAPRGTLANGSCCMLKSGQ